MATSMGSSVFKGLLLGGFVLLGLHEVSASLHLRSIGVQPFGSAGNLLVHAVLWLPLVIALAGVVALRWGRAASVFLGVAVFWWTAVGVTELVDLVQQDYLRVDASPVETAVRLTSIVAISILSVGYLLWDTGVWRR